VTTPRPVETVEGGSAARDGVVVPVPPASDPAPVAPLRLSFRARLTLALVIASILPLAAFAVVLAVVHPAGADETVVRLLVFAIAVIVALAILVAYILAADLTAPLRTIAAALDRASAGDATAPIAVPGDDELARLAESHNRLAADLERRNSELRAILAATAQLSPRDSVDRLADLAGLRARGAFAMIDAAVYLGDPRAVPPQETVPGESIPVRAELAVGHEPLGVLYGRLPATRRWEPADQDLLELYASEIAIAIRNAQLFARVDEQNERLLELDAAKDDFLRGVSHNLQTPLASIRAYASQLETERSDRRLGIVVEQADRLSRMVRQLLTVSRLESGALRPRADVLALAPRVRRTWEALGTPGVPFRLDDHAEGWLAIADADQLDQVLWALLDNAIKYGGGTAIEATVAAEADVGRVRVTIADRGPGVTEEDRERLFTRFERGSHGSGEDGSGLGLYVSRELCRAMDGDLVLEPAEAGHGAAFSILLPGEPGEES
jgi:signal transduction histidine kinase/HAMP domain-containing protein